MSRKLLPSACQLDSGICYLVICYLVSCIWYILSGICYLLSCYLVYVIWYLAYVICYLISGTSLSESGTSLLESGSSLTGIWQSIHCVFFLQNSFQQILFSFLRVSGMGQCLSWFSMKCLLFRHLHLHMTLLFRRK